MPAGGIALRYWRCLLFGLAAILLHGCDRGHGPQPVIVSIEELAAEWNRAGKTWQVDELLLLDSGRNLYQRNCAGCHLSSGAGQLTIGAPALQGSAVVTGPQAGLIHVVMNGRNSMPAFGRGKSKAELAAILSYVRNAWGNTAGDVVMVSAMETPGP